MHIEYPETDGRYVLGTGSIIAFENNPVKLKITSPTEPDAEPLYLIFEFVDDPANGDPVTKPSLKGDTLTLTLINYVHSLGTGTGKPILIGENPIANMYVHFRVYGFNEDFGDKLLFYTLYEVKKPKDPEESSQKKKTARVKKNGK